MPELKDTLIILFVVLLILVASSLTINALVRKFGPHAKRSQAKQAHQQQYQKILNELQSLETAYDPGTDSNDISDQLEEKKQTAAELLRQIHPALDEELSFYQLEEELGQMQARINLETQNSEIFICPNCGSKVWVGDKFCANCGFRLQG